MSDQIGASRLRWPLRIAAERRAGVLVLVASGRLSHTSVGSLTSALDAAIGRESGGLVLDIAQVDYISSAGIVALYDASGRFAQNGCVLVLCAVGAPVRIALDLAGLLPRLVIELSRDDAVARVRSRNGS